MKIVRYGSLKISKIDKRLCGILKESLTRTIKQYNKSVIETISFYKEDDNFLYIPRFYPLDNWMMNCQIIDEQDEGLDINIECNIKPRNEIQEKAIDYMVSHNKGIINLNTGEGKTVVAIAAIAEIKKKTLILLHRTNLVGQWVTRIEEFTNMKFGEDIGILKNSKIHESFSNSIVIATVQSLMSALDKRKSEIINELRDAKFGVLISDELHVTTGAKKFSDCALFIPAKKVFGLSATPYRHDGTSDILTYHLGPIYKPEGDSGIMDAKVTVILFDFGFLPKSKKYIYWGDSFQRSRYLNLLKKSESLSKVCMGLLDKFKKDKSVFLIAERIKFIEILYEKFNYDNKNTFIQKDKNDNLKNQFIFATPGKLRDGIDVPDKDTLILTSPIGNIQQICGRILRVDENKETPIVIDLVDIGCPDISSTLYYRLKFYKSKNWNIQFIYINNGKMIPIKENDIKELLKK